MNTLAAFVIAVLVIWLVVAPMAEAAEKRRAEKGRRLTKRVMGEWPKHEMTEPEWDRVIRELHLESAPNAVYPTEPEPDMERGRR